MTPCILPLFFPLPKALWKRIVPLAPETMRAPCLVFVRVCEQKAVDGGTPRGALWHGKRPPALCYGPKWEPAPRLC